MRRRVRHSVKVTNRFSGCSLPPRVQDPKGNIAGRIGGWAARRPHDALAGWLAVMLLLSVVGLGVHHRLHPTGLAIAGAPSDIAMKEADRRFGQRSELLVLLDGKPKDVANAKTVLARTLGRQGVSFVGPVVRKPNGAGLFVAQIPGEMIATVKNRAPGLRDTIKAANTPGVNVYIGGYPDLAGAIQTSLTDAISRFERIALPMLILILLLVFRTPLAAAIPLLAGVTTVLAAAGGVSIANELYPLDAFAMTMASLMGVALGVDYSLLLVSRFREELAAGMSPEEAAVLTAESAGHTAVAAALILLLAVAVVALIAPGDLLFSCTVGIAIAAAISAFTAIVATPATLRLTGARVNAMPLFGRSVAGGTSGITARLAKPRRRPALLGGATLAILVGMTAMAFAVETGPPGAWGLPDNHPSARDSAAMQRILGAAWAPPYQVLLTVEKGSITDPERLKLLANWQRQQARRSDVSAVFGPGEIERETRKLQGAQQQVARSTRTLKRGVRDQRKLRSGLTRANAGVRDLRAGLADAAAGARQLDSGGAAAASGARQLASGMTLARSGSAQLRRGLSAALGGTTALTTGADRVAAGNRQLRDGLATAIRQSAAAGPGARQLSDGLISGAKDLDRLKEPVEAAQNQLQIAREQLDQVPTADRNSPAVREARASVTAALALIDSGSTAPNSAGLLAGLNTIVQETNRAQRGALTLSDAVTELRTGLIDARDAAAELTAGSSRIAAGARQTGAGLRVLQTGASDLDDGITQLDGNGARITDGIIKLQAGAERLATELNQGAAKAQPLSAGISEMERAVAASVRASGTLSRELGKATQLVSAADSGYLPLALIDTGPKADRVTLGTSLNVDRGGNAAIVTVFGRGDSSRWGHPLRSSLATSADALARDMGAQALVGGQATIFQDFERQIAIRLPLLIIAMGLATWLALVFVLRSPILAAIGVGLTLVTVGAALGVLVLLFVFSQRLGGVGYIDSTMLTGTLAITFALSLDYTVFLLMRMREEHDVHGSIEEAVQNGLFSTASVVTGAAVVMVSVFSAFALSPLTNLRQMGIGLALAVLIDATIIRLILLPAAVRLAGEACWRTPRWLDRRPRAEAPAPPARLHPRGPLGLRIQGVVAVLRGSTRIFAWASGSASAVKAASTPSSPTVPVTSGRGSTFPSASMCSVWRNSGGV